MTTQPSSPGTYELSPCPFCGGEAIDRREIDGFPMIYCESEECFGPQTTARTFEDALIQWNRRSSPAQLPASPVIVTIFAQGDNENTPADVVHHALEYARKAGFIDTWSDPIDPAELRSPLSRIKQIIEDVDNRCLAADGPVTPTNEEIALNELQRIYALACGKSEEWRPHQDEIFAAGAKKYGAASSSDSSTFTSTEQTCPECEANGLCARHALTTADGGGK